MGNFDEAMICCKRHLEIARELGDKVSISKLVSYYLVFHTVLMFYYTFDNIQIVE